MQDAASLLRGLNLPVDFFFLVDNGMQQDG